MESSTPLHAVHQWLDKCQTSHKAWLAVRSCMETAMVAKPHWGVVYFQYDWFSAIRTDLVRQARMPKPTCAFV